MPYEERKISNIENSFGYSCPCEYETIRRDHFIKHVTRCLDIESGEYEDGLTVEDYINRESNIIQLVTTFITTKYLSTIQTLNGENIRNIIKIRLLDNGDDYKGIDYDVYRIYEFFFSVTEDENNEIINELLKFIKERHA
jgi:hypothetical protein